MMVALDTNILIYATLGRGDPRELMAQDCYARAVTAGNLVFLLQTLGEFAHVAQRKFSLAPKLVGALTREWRETAPVLSATLEDFDAALESVVAYKIGFWDALLIATARRVGVLLLLSEDLQDGRRFGELRVLNPFLPTNKTALDRLLGPVA